MKNGLGVSEDLQRKLLVVSTIRGIRLCVSKGHRPTTDDVKSALAAIKLNAITFRGKSSFAIAVIAAACGVEDQEDMDHQTYREARQRQEEELKEIFDQDPVCKSFGPDFGVFTLTEWNQDQSDWYWEDMSGVAEFIAIAARNRPKQSAAVLLKLFETTSTQVATMKSI